MHIAYLTPEYPHERTKHAGGMGTSIKNLAEEIVELGHLVTVFVYGQEEDEVFKDSGIHFHKIKHQTYKFAGFYLYRKYIQKYVNNHAQDIDLIEAPDWTGITAFMQLSKPLVIRFHGSDTYFCHIEGRQQKWKNKFFEKNAVKKAVAYIAPTHFAGEKSMELFGLDSSKLRIIHYGLQLMQFENTTPENYKQYNLLNIGTIIRKKGLFQLAQMFNRIVEKESRATLTLIGSDSPDIKTGSRSSWQLVEQVFTPPARKQVQYLGKVAYEEVQNHIKNAHVCVFPSLAETLGMVTIESMALQKAVVNTDIGWARDLITHQHDGFMHHPDDIEAYVETIIDLLNDPKRVLEVAINARKTIESKFDIKQLARQNINFYESLFKALN